MNPPLLQAQLFLQVAQEQQQESRDVRPQFKSQEELLMEQFMRETNARSLATMHLSNYELQNQGD